MASRGLYWVEHGYRMIKWEKAGTSTAAALALTSPAAAFLSVGFGAISAGASLYNTFQLAKQSRVLDSIARKLDLVEFKVDYVTRGIEQLTRLMAEVAENTQDIKEIAYIKVFFDGAREHFEQQLKGRTVSAESIAALAGDIQSTWAQVTQNRNMKDAPIPNWMVEKAMPVFSFFKVLNVYLIESHNALSGYNPITIRRYFPLEGTPIYLTEEPDSTEAAEMIIGLEKVHKVYHLPSNSKRPRLKWLSAFLWEAKMAQFLLCTSTPLAGQESRHLELPVIDLDQLPQSKNDPGTTKSGATAASA